MKAPTLISFSLLAVTAHAQLSTGSLGPSGLAPRTPRTNAPAPAAPATPASPSPQSNTVAKDGLLLFPGWDKRVTGPARTANRDMADLRAILSDYGKPGVDLNLHPEMEVFPGIPYLTPLKTVETMLVKKFGGSFGFSTEFLIATEGFPKGLKFRKYDKASLGIGANTHFYLLIDGADRVISTAFVGRGAPAFVPAPFPVFVPVPGTRSRNDLIDKSDGSALAHVADARSSGRYVVVYTQSKRNITWYVPEPLINLILYCSQL